MTTTLAPPARRTASLVAPPRSFGVLLLVLAAALLANSVLGPLGANLMDYPISGTVRNQLIGLEVVTVALVVPWCVAAGARALRGKADAAVLAFGPSAYTAYMFVQYVLGPEYGEYRAVVLLHVALTTLSVGLMLWSWSLSRDVALPILARRRDRAYAAVLLGLALFVVLRYAGAIAGSFSSTRIPEEFAEARTFHWSIFLLDIGMVVPATVVGAVALLQGHNLGRRGLYATTGWFALVPPSVAAMAATMLVNDDPNASAATGAVLSVASVVFAAFAVVVYRPLLSPPSTGPQANRPVAAGPSTQSPDVPVEDDETAASTAVHEGR